MRAGGRPRAVRGVVRGASGSRGNQTKARQKHCSIVSGKCVYVRIYGGVVFVFFYLVVFVILWMDRPVEFACRLYFSLFLSLSLLLYSIFFCLFSVVDFCSLSVSASFSVSIDRSCIRLLSPLFSLLCFMLGVWVR